jgi:hypothetical protein
LRRADRPVRRLSCPRGARGVIGWPSTTFTSASFRTRRRWSALSSTCWERAATAARRA